jgi:hypothetical protein
MILSIILYVGDKLVTVNEASENTNLPSRVTNPATDSGGTDDEDTLAVGLPEDLTGVALSDSLDLLKHSRVLE